MPRTCFDLLEEPSRHARRLAAALLPGSDRCGINAKKRGEDGLRHPKRIAHATNIRWSIRTQVDL